MAEWLSCGGRRDHLSPALERWSALIPSSGSIYLRRFSAGRVLGDNSGSGQNRDGVIEEARVALALVFQHTFPSLILGEVGSVSTSLLRTLVSLWRVLASRI